MCLLSDQSSCITSLAESFGYESAKLQGKITDSVTLLKTCMKELQDEGRAKGWLRIYKHTRPPSTPITALTIPRSSYLTLLAWGRPIIPVFVFQRRGGIAEFLERECGRVRWSRPG